MKPEHTMKQVTRTLALVLMTTCVCVSHAIAGKLGADVNADVDAFGHDQMDMPDLLQFAQKSTIYPLPLYNQPPNDHVRYWENMVEQYQAAQLDFVAVWLKGNNQPATFAHLVTALRKRGAVQQIKVMPFDDNPASWTAMWNYDHGNGYNYKVPFDVSNPANWSYIWDKNLKVFFENVPDADRFKIDGRPVYRIWSGAPAFLSHLNGNGSKLLTYIRHQCQKIFGFNPYIIVPEEWVKNDPSSAQPGVVDAVCPWFTPVPGPNYSTWNTYTWNGVTTGICIPEFHIANNTDPNAATWIVPARHGQTLTEGLRATAGTGKCAATFIEGFDDYWENTTLWRARNLTPQGQPLGYAQTRYDYPNQRINIVRRFSNNPFPINLKEDAAGCDTFSGGVPLPGKPNFYRNGSIAIEDCKDAQSGYDVCDTQPGETLTWREVPIQGTVHLQVRVATTQPHRRLHVVLDGKPALAVTLPMTSGKPQWQAVDLGQFTFPYRSTHTVTLVCDTGGVNIAWWRVRTVQFPAGAYTLINRDSGEPLTGTWTLRPLGHTLYVATSPRLMTQHWTITPQTDGYCTLRGCPTSGQSQEWSLAPAR